MEYTFDTVYGQRATTAMARTLRKTIRQKHSRRARVFGWVAVGLGLLMLLPLGSRTFALNVRTVVTGIVILILLCVLLWEDPINGYIARKRMLKGTERATTVFREEGYSSETEVGKSEWGYDRIGLLVETDEYFIFVFDASHAQLYEKKNLTGGTPEQFRAFIQQKTGKQMAKLAG